MVFDFAAVKRIISDLVLKVSNQPFTGNAAFYNSGNDLKDDLGLDSMEIMELAAYVNSFFNLFEAENPPYLLLSSKLDEWVDMVLTTRQKHNESLSFNTSGTSGSAKVIRHSTAFLEREVAFLSSVFSTAQCVIPHIPSYSIFGFLSTIALPLALGVSVVYPSEINWRRLPKNALIAGTPFNWQLLINSLGDMKLHCLGVSAAAPLPQSLYRQINETGIKLTELYGATETAGIAYRQQADQPFRLFPYWQLLLDGRVSDIDTNETFSLMDEIEQHTENTFDLIGRKDKQVKIAGHLVNLDTVALAIKNLPNVQQCNISAKATDGGVTIQAVITLFKDEEKYRDDIKTEIKRRLKAHERPQQIYFS